MGVHAYVSGRDIHASAMSATKLLNAVIVRDIYIYIYIWLLTTNLVNTLGPLLQCDIEPVKSTELKINCYY